MTAQPLSDSLELAGLFLIANSLCYIELQVLLGGIII